MGGNIIKLAHWLTVVSWGVALQAYMANGRVSWENLFALALGFGGLGILGFVWGARMRDKALLDMRQMKREKSSGVRGTS